ncbi:hypothetical protein Amal_03710 [Acetobacter malorum]|uniref:Uncharacterized protein n=1 Tax=Acetobacter malorum TaxID=178901 RepID=A0A177G799_9PROT|nr:hypothetical protein Amal_03710 [Acetobacter malorum]
MRAACLPVGFVPRSRLMDQPLADHTLSVTPIQNRYQNFTPYGPQDVALF